MFLIASGAKERFGFSDKLFAAGSPPRRLLALFMLAVAIAYCIAYITAPSVPGPSRPGWFAWFDQGKYLRSAKALAVGDLSPASHFYPPLYPMLGAVFVRWLPRHPFLIVDLAAFLVTAFGFVAAGSRFIWWPVAALVFLLTVVADHSIFNQFVYPWTSTPVAAIFSLLVLLLARNSPGAPPAVSLAFGMLYGLLLPLRPVDAAVFAPLLLSWCWALATNRKQSTERPMREVTSGFALLGLGLLPGLILFFGFNLLVFNSWLGGYLQTGVYHFGFTHERLLEKAVSMLVDSGSVYLVPRAALLVHFPWLLLSAVGAALALVQGPLVLRTLAICLLTAAVFYLPYNDFLPNGLWHDSNIHYFTWMFPWLGFLALWPLFVLLRAYRSDRTKARRLTRVCGGVLGVALVGSLVRFDLRGKPATIRIVGSHLLEIRTAGENNLRPAADVIDLFDVRGDDNALYHGNHWLNVGGSIFRSYRDFRVVPAPWGARVVFLRSVPAGRVRLQLDPRVALRTVATAGTASRIAYTLGYPCWIAACGHSPSSGRTSVNFGAADGND